MKEHINEYLSWINISISIMNAICAITYYRTQLGSDRMALFRKTFRIYQKYEYSEAYPAKFGTTSSAPATLWDPPTTATTSAGEKPTDPKRSRMEVMLSVGWGTRFGGDAATGAGRPIKNGIRGAPGHWTRLTAPASWMLRI